jgi:hypothetical protein
MVRGSTIGYRTTENTAHCWSGGPHRDSGAHD